MDVSQSTPICATSIPVSFESDEAGRWWANGDMGENETASFDSIFYFRHCSIDYAFWKWQERHEKTVAGSLGIIQDYDGTPYLAPGTKLDMSTSLYKPDQTYYSSNEATDIVKQLGYTYGLGSLDVVPAGLGDSLQEIEKQIIKFKRVHKVNRADYPGSFVIRTFARGKSSAGDVEIGREAVLSRHDIAGCDNCQNKLDVQSLVPLYQGLLDALRGDGKEAEIKYWAEIHTYDNLRDTPKRVFI